MPKRQDNFFVTQLSDRTVNKSVTIVELYDLVHSGGSSNNIYNFDGSFQAGGTIATIPSDSSLTFVDDRGVNAIGIEYDDDYSSSFTSNSLISKTYADSFLGGNALDGSITTPVNNGYVVAWNDSGYYELVEQSGGGSAAVWGSITGTLSAQDDLNSELNTKAEISGTLSQFSDVTYSPLIEGQFLVYKSSAWQNASITTDDVPEQTNLYYTDARASLAAPIQSISSGTGINVDSGSTPSINIQSSLENLSITSSSFNGVDLVAGGSTAEYLNKNGEYSTPAGGDSSFILGSVDNLFGTTSGDFNDPGTVSPATDQASAEAVRDAYATANSAWLQEYDDDVALTIWLTFENGLSSRMVAQGRNAGAWEDKSSTIGVRGASGTDGASGNSYLFASITDRDEYFNKGSNLSLLEANQIIVVNIDNVGTIYYWSGDTDPDTYDSELFIVTQLGASSEGLVLGIDGAEISSGSNILNLRNASGDYSYLSFINYSDTGSEDPFYYELMARATFNVASVSDIVLDHPHDMQFTSSSGNLARSYTVKPATEGDLRVQAWYGTLETDPEIVDRTYTVSAGDVGNDFSIEIPNPTLAIAGDDTLLKFSGVDLYGGTQTSGTFIGEEVPYLDTDLQIATSKPYPNIYNKDGEILENRSIDTLDESSLIFNQYAGQDEGLDTYSILSLDNNEMEIAGYYYNATEGQHQLNGFQLSGGNGFTYTDETGNGALKYADDYSGSYTTRSLVDKNYTDSTLGGKDTLGISTPTATENGYSVVWDNDLNHYKLDDITPGSSTNIYNTSSSITEDRVVSVEDATGEGISLTFQAENGSGEEHTEVSINSVDMSWEASDEWLSTGNSKRFRISGQDGTESQYRNDLDHTGIVYHSSVNVFSDDTLTTQGQSDSRNFYGGDFKFAGSRNAWLEDADDLAIVSYNSNSTDYLNSGSIRIFDGGATLDYSKRDDEGILLGTNSLDVHESNILASYTSKADDTSTSNSATTLLLGDDGFAVSTIDPTGAIALAASFSATTTSSVIQSYNIGTSQGTNFTATPNAATIGGNSSGMVEIGVIDTLTSADWTMAAGMQAGNYDNNWALTLGITEANTTPGVVSDAVTLTFTEEKGVQIEETLSDIGMQYTTPLYPDIGTVTWWIPHVEYTNSVLGSQALDSSITNPNVSQTGYRVAWNSTADEYELVPPSEGESIYNISSTITDDRDVGISTHYLNFSTSDNASNASLLIQHNQIVATFDLGEGITYADKSYGSSFTDETLIHRLYADGRYVSKPNETVIADLRKFAVINGDGNDLSYESFMYYDDSTDDKSIEFHGNTSGKTFELHFLDDADSSALKINSDGDVGKILTESGYDLYLNNYKIAEVGGGDEITLPNVDGDDGQVLTTDGLGSWAMQDPEPATSTDLLVYSGWGLGGTTSTWSYISNTDTNTPANVSVVATENYSNATYATKVDEYTVNIEVAGDYRVEFGVEHIQQEDYAGQFASVVGRVSINGTADSREREISYSLDNLDGDDPSFARNTCKGQRMCVGLSANDEIRVDMARFSSQGGDIVWDDAPGANWIKIYRIA